MKETVNSNINGVANTGKWARRSWRSVGTMHLAGRGKELSRMKWKAPPQSPPQRLVESSVPPRILPEKGWIEMQTPAGGQIWSMGCLWENEATCAVWKLALHVQTELRAKRYTFQSFPRQMRVCGRGRLRSHTHRQSKSILDKQQLPMPSQICIDFLRCGDLKQLWPVSFGEEQTVSYLFKVIKL